VTILIEGTYVLVRALGELNLVGGQLDQFRTYLELLFSPISPAGVSARGAVASTSASRET